MHGCSTAIDTHALDCRCTEWGSQLLEYSLKWISHLLVPILPSFAFFFYRLAYLHACLDFVWEHLLPMSSMTCNPLCMHWKIQKEIIFHNHFLVLNFFVCSHMQITTLPSTDPRAAVSMISKNSGKSVERNYYCQFFSCQLSEFWKREGSFSRGTNGIEEAFSSALFFTKICSYILCTGGYCEPAPSPL